MIHYLKGLLKPNPVLKFILIAPLCINFITFYSNQAKAGIEFQWDDVENYKKLRWHHKNGSKQAKNKIFFFLRPSDRKTGLLKINIKIPDNFKTNLKEKNISICKVQIGGFDSKTKCLESIPSDIEISEKGKIVDIYPYSPIPYNRDSYALVFKVVNPKRAGLYQFHSFGQSSGQIPVSNYLGSWTIKIDQQ